MSSLSSITLRSGSDLRTYGSPVSNINSPNLFQFSRKMFFNIYFPSLQTDQLMSEKLTGADHTKLDDQFTQMEKITDVFLEVEVGYYCQL